jgi:ABC-2 type transport system ATP-binding protein
MHVIDANAVSRLYRSVGGWKSLIGLARGAKGGRAGTLAVDDLFLHVEQGEAIGFIGENGSGKSTTIKLLTGIVKPTTGSVRVNGLDPHKSRIENAKRISAILGHKTQLWWDLPAAHSFNMLRHVYGIPSATFRNNLDRFTEMLDLGSLVDKPVRTLSLGQRVRCDIAAGLLHDPNIIFLDEPSLGLDFRVKEQVYSFLRHINKERGTTVFLTSHDLEDVESLCPRLAVLSAGRKMFDGTTVDFLARLGGDRIISFNADVQLLVNALPFGRLIRSDGPQHLLLFDSSRIDEHVAYAAMVNFHGASRVSLRHVSLKDVLSNNHIPVPIEGRAVGDARGVAAC